MAGTEAQEDKNLPDIWQYVPMDQFSIPRAPARSAVRKGILGLWDRLRKDFTGRTPGKQNNNKSADDSLVAQSQLQFVPQKLLNQAAPRPDSRDIESALDKALVTWLDSDKADLSVQFIISPPCSATDQVLIEWATNRQYRTVSAPDSEQILQGNGDWLPPFQACPHSPFVIPNLERWYVRHCDGLNLIRKLLGLLSVEKPRCLIGCNSWSWAYLNKIFRLESIFKTPFILQALDPQRLQLWFQSLANSSKQRNFIFRQTDNGNLVLPLPERTNHSDQENDKRKQKTDDAGSKETTDFLAYLAGYSRGIPGVCWSIWRYCLRSAKEEDLDDKANKLATSDSGHTMWLKPWSQTDLPTMRNATSQRHIFVLHNILLHGSMTSNLIADLLPFAVSEVSEALEQLRAAHMLEEKDGIWCISPIGYPAVRQFLKGEEYLLDNC